MAQEVETKETSTDNLLDFNWENDGVDFFGISEEPKKEVVEKEVKEKEEVKPATAEKETEEKEETKETSDEFFEVETETETKETKEVETSKEQEQGEDGYWNDVYKDFKEVGLFKHVELEEGEELDSEKLFELQQQEYETEVSERLKNWATEELDEDAKEFIKFKRDGGNTADFFKTYQQSTGVPTGSLEDESYQDAVIRHQLAQEEWDKDEIEDRLKYLTESGRKEKVAKKYDSKIKEQDTKNKQALLKSAETTRLQQKEQENTFRDTIKTALVETKEVNGVKITPKDKSQLYNFLTKKSHKISDTKSVTGFQKKLSEVFQDTDKMLLLAKLVNSDFDMTDIKKKTVTKKTKEIKSNLEQRKNLRPSNSGSSLQGERLADLF